MLAAVVSCCMVGGPPPIPGVLCTTITAGRFDPPGVMGRTWLPEAETNERGCNVLTTLGEFPLSAAVLTVTTRWPAIAAPAVTKP